MKKLLSIILSALILSGVFSVAVSAKNISDNTTTVTVDGEERNYIRNEFYKLYHDCLFEQTYSTHREYVTIGITTIDQVSPDISQIVTVPFEKFRKIDSELYEEIKNSEDTYYLSVYLKYTEYFSEDKNTSLLNSINDIDEILYVGNTTPCAVIVVSGKNIDSILESENVEYVSYAFCSVITGNASVIPENGNRTYSPNAGDARKILRYSAGLYDLSDMQLLSEKKEFLIMSDINFDGKITSADARTALRIAACLEEKIEFTHKTNSFWSCN